MVCPILKIVAFTKCNSCCHRRQQVLANARHRFHNSRFSNEFNLTSSKNFSSLPFQNKCFCIIFQSTREMRVLYKVQLKYKGNQLWVHSNSSTMEISSAFSHFYNLTSPGPLLSKVQVQIENQGFQFLNPKIGVSISQIQWGSELD